MQAMWWLSENTGAVCSLPCRGWEAQGWVPKQVCRVGKHREGRRRGREGNGNYSRNEKQEKRQITHRQCWVLIKRLKTDLHHWDENRGQSRWRRTARNVCWKLSWSLASLAWLNKEHRHWKTVCLPAFIRMFRCQYRNSSVSEESERSMRKRGECN